MPVSVGFVLTEQPDHITPAIAAGYARAAGVLAATAGGACEPAGYLEPLPAGDVLVLSGSWAPWAVHDRAALDDLGARLAADGRPVLGICAGAQLLARLAGGAHDHMADGRGEHGFATVELVSEHPALAGIPARARVFEDHSDEISELPASLELVATNGASRFQAFVGRERPWWGTQFHPERFTAEEPDGRTFLQAFFRSAE
jgi:GMP synthase-like glutamine amidotransferase